MRDVSDDEVRLRLKLDNPWWRDGVVPDYLAPTLKRAHFEPFFDLVTETGVRRAIVLMGPRRVGKTVLIHQTIQTLIADGTPPADIMYLSLDTPVYTGVGLEKLLRIQFGDDTLLERRPRWVFFDEVQYLKDWERHLKSLVDTLPGFRFAVSGSAAAALRLKSTESGAGRFTDFRLPPLAFCEYLGFVGIDDIKGMPIDDLNREFFNYINYGGFPETVLVPSVRSNMERFIRSDILDKVLLRDLPDLYGIDSIQDLNRLFTVLAYNTAEEVSYDGLSQSAEMAKNTIRKYLDYLEAAFLILRLPRIDQNAKRFKRETHFKVHLTNPSIRAALFGAVGQDDPIAGNLVETAIVAQLLHTKVTEAARYARWADGEVDLVISGQHLDLNSIGTFADRTTTTSIEIKWSDRYAARPEELRSLMAFAKKTSVNLSVATTRTKSLYQFTKEISLQMLPAAYLCDDLGRAAMDDPFESLNAMAIEAALRRE
ncbi:ATP-binding protein [Azospirillum sp. RWY-5-1]|uniref:ATP-binding protein n=1 Tax=Azospirillum oleiclasticum TaxID=2735135 RepID=A0ABX2TKE5_9PROT|nr:ATP-binding protein [Azospirillum oleiclasticum]NYZ17352.1 ATP-binding protein [Azospirillum oleiclasticum]NYZ24706.1 ATP-binding protein [Azospirillum oleiclasticum]